MGRPRQGAACDVLCRIRKDGSVEIRNGAQDIGTGTRTIMAMVAAEELGIPVAQVTAFIGDTNDPIGPGSGGSTTAPTHDAGGAAGRVPGRPAAPAARRRQVGREAERARLRGRRRPRLERSAEVDEVGGRVPPHPGRRDLGARQARRRTTTSREAAAPGAYQTDTGGVHFAEVEVDTETGQVRVERYLAMQDCGTIINPLTAESQVNGAIIQGISYALFEERHLDRQKGQQVNADLDHYKIAGSRDMPEVKVVLTDVVNGANNVGLCGLGEGPAVPRRRGDRERGLQRDRRARARAADDAGQGARGARGREERQVKNFDYVMPRTVAEAAAAAAKTGRRR